MSQIASRVAMDTIVVVVHQRASSLHTLPDGASLFTWVADRGTVLVSHVRPVLADLWLCLVQWLQFSDVVALGATSRAARLRCTQRYVWESMLWRDFPAKLPRAPSARVLPSDAFGSGTTGTAAAGGLRNSSPMHAGTPGVDHVHGSGGDGGGSDGVRRLGWRAAGAPDDNTANFAPQVDGRNPLALLRGRLRAQHCVVARTPRACAARQARRLGGTGDRLRLAYWERQRVQAAYRRYNRRRNRFLHSEQAHLRGGYVYTLRGANRAVGVCGCFTLTVSRTAARAVSCAPSARWGALVGKYRWPRCL